MTDWSSYAIDAAIALKKMDEVAVLQNWAEAGRQAQKVQQAADELALWFAAMIAQK